MPYRPVALWNSLEANDQTHQMRAAQRGHAQAPSVLAWLKTIPTKELIHRGKISEATDTTTRLDEVLRFFGVASVEAWKAGWEKPQFAFRKSPTVEGQKGAMANLAAAVRIGRGRDGLQTVQQEEVPGSPAVDPLADRVGAREVHPARGVRNVAASVIGRVNVWSMNAFLAPPGRWHAGH